MSRLSDSYRKTLAALSNGKADEAAKQYQMAFVPTVKKLFSEAAGANPKRYEKMEDWPGWARAFYTLSLRANTAMARKEEKTLERLEAIREHVFTLHEKTGALTSSDRLHMLWRKVKGGAIPSAADLKPLLEAVRDCGPPARVKADPKEFERAKGDWTRQSTNVLDDGEVSDDEASTLREATRVFYGKFGLDLE